MALHICTGLYKLDKKYRLGCMDCLLQYIPVTTCVPYISFCTIRSDPLVAKHTPMLIGEQKTIG